MLRLLSSIILSLAIYSNAFAIETVVGYSWDLTQSSNEWTATARDIYYAQHYGYKKLGGTLVNKSITDFSLPNKSQIIVGFKCMQYIGGKSKITIYLVNSRGVKISSGVEVTPIGGDNAANTTYQYATFTSNLDKATGFMMEVTTYDKNILINGASYEITYDASEEAVLVATDGTRYWATFSSVEHTFIETEGVYTVTAEGDGLKLNELNRTELNAKSGYWIPANTPVLLMDIDTKIMLHHSTSTPIDQLGLKNNLVATTVTGYYTEDTDADDFYYYKLAYNNYNNQSDLGFYWGAENGTGYFKVKEGGAILRLPRTSGNAMMGYAFTDDLLSAIKVPVAKKQNETVYNLAGQKINKTMGRGIYIVGNKKIIR